MPSLTTNFGTISADSSSNTVRTALIGHTFRNFGLLKVSAGTMEMGASTFQNSASIQVLSGSFTLRGSWDNSSGVISHSGGQVNFGGLVDLSKLGTYNRTGGVAALAGQFNNPSTTADLTAAIGPWHAEGGAEIVGGSIVSPIAGQPLNVVGGLIVNAATIDSDLSLASGAELLLTGSCATTEQSPPTVAPFDLVAASVPAISAR